MLIDEYLKNNGFKFVETDYGLTYKKEHPDYEFYVKVDIDNEEILFTAFDLKCDRDQLEAYKKFVDENVEILQKITDVRWDFSFNN